MAGGAVVCCIFIDSNLPKLLIMAYSERRVRIQNTAVRSGISFGTALAIAISWSLHKSILWAIVHGIFGWLYVLYYFFTR